MELGAEAAACYRRRSRNGRRVLPVEGDRVKYPGKSWLPGCAAAALTTMMWPLPAQAHLNSTGMGPIYDGFMHFLMSPEDLVPVLALALLAGLRGANFGRRALFVLPAVWLVGGLLGLTTFAANDNLVMSAGWFLVLGGLLAAGARVSLRVTTGLATLLGLYHGSSWIFERKRDGPVRNSRRNFVRPGLRGVCSCRRGGCVCGSVADGLATDRGACGGQLDRRERPADARLGGSGKVNGNSPLKRPAFFSSPSTRVIGHCFCIVGYSEIGIHNRDLERVGTPPLKGRILGLARLVTRSPN